MKDFGISASIAKMFLIFLPLRMISPFQPIRDVLGMQAESFSLIFLILGLFFCVLENRNSTYLEEDEQKQTLLYYWKVVIVVGFTSLIMALYVSMMYGEYNNNSPIFAVVKIILNYIQYGLVFLYSKEIFKILSKNEILKYLTISTRICLVVGYLQIATLNSLPLLTPIYRNLANFFSWKTFNGQIALTLYEPSWAAMFIGIVVIPLHISNIIMKNSEMKKSIFEILLWIPVILMTRSTTAYLLVFAALSSAFLYTLFANNTNFISKILVVIVSAAGFYFIKNPNYLDDLLGFNFSYLMFEKATNLEDYSTAVRSISLIGNWEIFKEFPIIGCGNGLQGYFFPTLIPNEYYRSLYLDRATTAMLTGSAKSIPNGQTFFPGILSGYGILGAILFVIFFFKCFKLLKKDIAQYRQFGVIYITAFLPIVISGIKSDFVGILYIWFILSIPFSIECDALNNKEKAIYGDVE